jgi:prepilin-type N-terminal cleavage/methylation domain-containing protein
VRARRGFTLVELLVSMALLVAFGTLLVRFLAGALDLWRGAERERDLAEKASAVFDLLGRDLRAVAMPRSEVPSSPAEYRCEIAVDDTDGDGYPDAVGPQLRFVRTLSPAQEREALLAEGLRGAQPTPGGTVVSLAPTAEGFAEVAWALSDDPDERDPALLLLYRGSRPMGLGPEGSLLREGFFEQPGALRSAMVPVASNVLGFSLLFPLDPLAPLEADRTSGSAVECWDSRRAGRLDARAHSGNAFPLDRTAASLDVVRDDVFPSRALVTLVLEADAGTGRLPQLDAAVGPDDRALLVDDPRALPREHPFLAKVGGEWVSVTAVSDRRLSLGRRGERGTVAAGHPPGAVVHVGETFRADFALPSSRQDWNR